MQEDKLHRIKKQANYARPIFLLLLVLLAVVFAAVLKVTESVLIPVTIAILISLVFEPILLTLNKKFKIPWLLGIFILFSIVIIVIWVSSALLVSSLRAIVALLPKYEERFTIIYTSVADIFQLPFDEENTLFENLWNQVSVRQIVQNFALSFSSNIFSFLQTTTVVVLFAIFFLLELRFLRQKLETVFGDENKDRATLIITDIIEQIIRYLSVKFYISLATGLLVFLGTLAIGLDFPIIWGFIAFVLNFIPNFGSIIAGIITSGFALLQFWPEPTPVILTIILMLGTNFVLGNFVEPRIQGQQLGLSPFVIIVSLSFWGWLWGFTGLVLGVPMMVILKIICQNFSVLQPISLLLGDYRTAKAQAESDVLKNDDTVSGSE
ncbi:MAG: AI-2E family transporter [Spirochaetales bacterium]